jgi:hypothetical protein
MKCITVKQPWASLICSGLKDIENRTWKTSFRGRILIHASQKPDYDIIYTNNKGIREVLEDEGFLYIDDIDAYCSVGKIIGSVEIVDCVINHESIWAEKTFFLCSKGYCGFVDTEESEVECESCPYWEATQPIYNWVLANPILFDKPIPAKGKLSFWEFDEKLLK